MGEKQAKDDVLKLIQLIDGNKDKIFRWGDVYRERSLLITVLAFGVFVLFVWFSMFSGSNFYQIGALTTAVIASMVGFFSFLERLREETLLTINYVRIRKICAEKEKFERQRLEKDKPLLKALIKIKARNREFDLKQIYDFNKDLFTPERLVERL